MKLSLIAALALSSFSVVAVAQSGSSGSAGTGTDLAGSYSASSGGTPGVSTSSSDGGAKDTGGLGYSVDAAFNDASSSGTPAGPDGVLGTPDDGK